MIGGNVLVVHKDPPDGQDGALHHTELLPHPFNAGLPRRPPPAMTVSVVARALCQGVVPLPGTLCLVLQGIPQGESDEIPERQIIICRAHQDRQRKAGPGPGSGVLQSVESHCSPRR